MTDKQSIMIRGFLYFCLFILQTAADLDLALKHYETLDDIDFDHHISRRSADGSSIHERQLKFDTLGRHFHLSLRQRSNILAPTFKLFVLDENLLETQIDYRPDSLYEGYVHDEPWTTEVKAFFDEDGTLTASISTPHEVYNIEPAWRHNTSFETAAKMIAYKKSDVIMEDDLGASYCGYVKGDVPVSSDAAEERQKRQVAFPQTSAAQKATKRDTCPLLLVADYRFFKNMGQGSLSRTTNYLIGLIDRVDSLYRKTNFSNGFTGMGFEIKEMRIHQHPTAVSPGSIHYNMEADAWQTRELLETFSRDSRFKKFCLAHLFTHQAFEGGVLGLAYIGSSRTYSVGGVCSPAYYKGGYQLFLNTGWSSSLNRYNRRLLTSEADLVTTHEFGHNWGSEHDPDTSECSPSTKDGGKHIMYTYSVSGYEPNNKMFSPCSKRAMGAVLLSKSKSCFTEKSSGFCGNFEVEEGEECDVGLGVQSDPCCSDECKLRPGAKCSDLNHICCDGCQVADNQKICHEAKNGSCEAEGRCSGISLTCPPPPHKPDGTACLDRGECQSGQCLSMCESQRMVSCICESKENDQDESKKKLDNSCQYCCKKNSNSPCEPFTGPDGMLIDLDDGIPCARGFCHQGTCEQQVQDLVERFWDIIENISPSDLVQFMRANIVGTIIVLSLVIWVPASCLVSYIDRKRRREEEDEQYWHSPENKDLYQWEQPVINIKRAENLRYRPSLRVQIPPPGSYSSTGPRSVYV